MSLGFIAVAPPILVVPPGELRAQIADTLLHDVKGVTHACTENGGIIHINVSIGHRGPH